MNTPELEHLVTRESTDLLTVHALDGTCVYASGEALPLVAVTPETLLDRRLQDFVARDDRAAIEQQIAAIHPGETRRLRYRIAAVDGATRWVETRMRRADPFLIGATREIDDAAGNRGAEWAQLRHEARTDWLTQLHNRWALEETLQAEMDRYLRSGHAFSIALLDVDHFKAVNDTFGHAFGDHVLRRIAAVAGHGRRSYDVLGRWGGDELLLVLPETSPEEAATVAARMVRAVAMERLAGPGGDVVTLSAGVASSSSAAAIDALVEHADRAMYVAKSLGGNRVCQFYAREVAPVVTAAPR